MRWFPFLSSFVAEWRDYPAEVNRVLGQRYLVQAMVGAGSYGLTYKCMDQFTGKPVAVKQARPSKELYARQLLAREATILKSLNHPRIPACIDLFTEHRNEYLVMSFLSGDTLEDLIFEKGKKYGEQDCLRITIQLLELVVYVHSQGYVHLDVRIPNVLFKDEQIYLIDLGLARAIGETPPPQAPAQRCLFQKHTVPSRPFKESEEASDLLDIGHFMLFMLYSAYEPDRDEEGNEKRSWQEELQLSPRLKFMIERLLQLSEPYSSSAEFMHDLKSLLTNNDYE
ncbi:serine/threonine protein kinase [Paenibacillus puldeungensis]|uniref:Serine/threonine protein kinase n=1 Tax=Paenibacillus puldeungensis TaxID=696536 RepID=A0ABW3S056_9BACL